MNTEFFHKLVHSFVGSPFFLPYLYSANGAFFGHKEIFGEAILTESMAASNFNGEQDGVITEEAYKHIIGGLNAT